MGVDQPPWFITKPAFMGLFTSAQIDKADASTNPAISAPWAAIKAIKASATVDVTDAAVASMVNAMAEEGIITPANARAILIRAVFPQLPDEDLVGYKIFDDDWIKELSAGNRKHWFTDPDLLKLLNTPIRLNKIASLKARKAAEREGIMARERALFALYDIPDDWPESIRWEWLARHLAGQLFVGCRTIAKGRGGPSQIRRLMIAKRRRVLLQEFETYRAANPHLSRKSAATNFVKKHRQECAEAGLTTANGFVRAIKKVPKL